MARLRMLPPPLGLAAPALRLPPKTTDRFYQSPEWRALVAQVKRLRGRWCQRCGSDHRVIGDHIVEIRDGGARLDPMNIELLCQDCHNAKTARARARRIASS